MFEHSEKWKLWDKEDPPSRKGATPIDLEGEDDGDGDRHRNKMLVGRMEGVRRMTSRRRRRTKPGTRGQRWMRDEVREENYDSNFLVEKRVSQDEAREDENMATN